LSEIATTGQNRSSLEVDSSIPIARYLIGSESLTRQAESCMKAGDLDEAFVALVKSCKLLIEVLPSQHLGYPTLDPETRKTLKAKGQWSLDQLSQLKVKIVDRFEAWRRQNPDAPLFDGTADANERKRAEVARKEMLRPVPSTGVMEAAPRLGSSSSSSSSTSFAPHANGASLDYIKPDRRDDFGFGAKDMLGHNRGGPSTAKTSR
jgi:hypothetical protein